MFLGLALSGSTAMAIAPAGKVSIRYLFCSASGGAGGIPPPGLVLPPRHLVHPARRPGLDEVTYSLLIRSVLVS